MAVIFHITDSKLWEKAQKDGLYHCPTLETEGFIHCSNAEQIEGVINRYYKNKTGLVLLEIEVEKVNAPIKYENTSGGIELFPHIYGSLNTGAVRSASLLPPQI